jgi:hypothetical protein
MNVIDSVTHVSLNLIVIEGDFDEATLGDDLLQQYRDLVRDHIAPPIALRRARFSGKYMMSADELEDIACLLAHIAEKRTVIAAAVED